VKVSTRLVLPTLLVAVGSITSAVAGPKGNDSLVFPVWEQMFDQYGFLTLDQAAPLDQERFSPSGLSRAEFLQENFSGGTITDMTALLPGEGLNGDVVFNGPVGLDHDLGNAAVAFAAGKHGTEQVFATVERASANAATTIEFELLQYPVSLGAGEPWSLRAEHLEGDIKAVMRFQGNDLSGMHLMRYSQGGYELVEKLKVSNDGSCGSGSAVAFCTGLAPFSLSSEVKQVWDADYAPMQPISALERIEIGIDTLALSPGISFESLIIRTPQDLVLSRTALTLVESAVIDEHE
jgi:hypothetical protein